MPSCCIVKLWCEKIEKSASVNSALFSKTRRYSLKCINAIGLENINPRHKNWFVCSLHFKENCFNRTLDLIRFHENSVPTIFFCSDIKFSLVGTTTPSSRVIKLADVFTLAQWNSRSIPVRTTVKMKRHILSTTFANHDVNHNVKECYKSKKTFLTRKEEAMAIRKKFPTKVPLILEKNNSEKHLPSLEKSKFLVPGDITMSQFLFVIRNRIKVKPNQALYLIINNRSMLSMSQTMAHAYENYSDEDGFLYITYASEEFFGYQDDMMQSVKEVEALRHRFPNKIPLYVERHVMESNVPLLGRKKFLVPQELTMSQFLYIVRTKMKLKETQALYLLVNDRMLVSHSMTMAQAYDQHRAHDGYLHITYASQEFFG